MTQTEELLYRGVECLHCAKPIPVSLQLANREADATAEGLREVKLRGRKCQVFHLRCPNCGKEKPYRTSEIREFSGTQATVHPGWLTPAWSASDDIKAKRANA